MSTIPSTMRAVVVDRFDGSADAVRVDDVPVPEPGPGEVLVRIGAAPMNPNDLMFLDDRYDIRREVPTGAGFEGMGEVVAAGSWIGRPLIGRRVACQAATHSGTWAEYAVAPTMQCIPLSASVSDAQGSTLLTSPFTSWVMVQNARKEGHRAIIQTAAAGALGQMVARLCVHFGLPAIHIVRRREQAELLQGFGVTHVVVSTEPDADAELKELAESLGATLCLDAVGGELTGRVLHAMPKGGVVRVYGDLSNRPIQLPNNALVFEGKRVEGFTMYTWTEQTSMAGQLWVARQVQTHLNGALAVDVRKIYALEEAAEALAAYRERMSGGKILLEMKR